jgi:hypothetical protein
MLMCSIQFESHLVNLYLLNDILLKQISKIVLKHLD